MSSYMIPVWVNKYCDHHTHEGRTYIMECVKADLTYPEAYLHKCPCCGSTEWCSILYPHVTWITEEDHPEGGKA